MPAGTIALTNNSAAVTGTGTSFTSELKANDFVVVVVGGVTYTLGVKSVESATALTLITAYGGATVSGLSWTPVPNATLVGITAQVAADVAKAIRGLNLDKANWQQIFSGAGNVTVTLPDGTSWNGPGWSYMASQYDNKADKTSLDAYAKKGANSDITSLSGLTSALPMSMGGTGAKTRESAKAAIEVGFIRDTQNWGNVETLINNIIPGGGVASMRDNAGNNTIYQYSTSVIARVSDTYSVIDVNHTNGNVLVAAWASGSMPKGNALWGSSNTTTDANGFIKRASPVIRVFNGEVLPADYLMSGFERAGQCMANTEAEGVAAKRLEEGVYEVTGCLGLATEGWGVEVPQNNNGYRQIYVQTEYESGVLTLKTYHRVNADAPKFLQNTVKDKVDGDPIDIPSGRWVDLRLSMPDDSIYNKHLKDLKVNTEAPKNETES